MAWVQFLVRELRPHKPWGSSSQLKKKKDNLGGWRKEEHIDHTTVTSCIFFGPWQGKEVREEGQRDGEGEREKKKK